MAIFDDELQFTGTTGRSARNNNPLNLEYRPGSYQDKYGATLEPTGGGKDKGPRFSAFPNMMAGYLAGIDQIRLDASRGHTLGTFVSKFSPRSENPTDQLITQYATALGVSPDTPLSQIDPHKLIVPMLSRESSTRIVGQGPSERGGVPVATYDDKSNLIPSQAAVGETPGLADFISTLLRTGAVPTRAPLSNEAQPAPGPPPDERKGEILSGLGMLAGLGTPTQARVGEMITTLGQKESDRARATVAARNLGYATEEEMNAAQKGAQIEGLQAAAALGRANVPKALAESIGTMYKTAVEKPVTITTKEGHQFTIPTSQVPDLIYKFGNLQINKEQADSQMALQKGQLTHLGFMNQLYTAHKDYYLAEIGKLKGAPAFDLNGKPIFNPDGSPFKVTAAEQVQLLLRQNPGMTASQQAVFHTLGNTLTKFYGYQMEAAKDISGNVSKRLAPELNAMKVSLGTTAQKLWETNDPYNEILAASIFSDLGVKPPPKILQGAPANITPGTPAAQALTNQPLRPGQPALGQPIENAIKALVPQSR